MIQQSNLAQYSDLAYFAIVRSNGSSKDQGLIETYAESHTDLLDTGRFEPNHSSSSSPRGCHCLPGAGAEGLVAVRSYRAFVADDGDGRGRNSVALALSEVGLRKTWLAWAMWADRERGKSISAC